MNKQPTERRPVEMVITKIIEEAGPNPWIDFETPVNDWIDMLRGVLPVVKENQAAAQTLSSVLKCISECRKNGDWSELDELIEASGLAQGSPKPASSEIHPRVEHADVREQVAKWMTRHSFSAGHGDTIEDLLKELAWQVDEIRCRRSRVYTLEATLRDVRDLLDGYVDAADGEYGRPAPNKAMQAQHAIDEVLKP